VKHRVDGPDERVVHRPAAHGLDHVAHVWLHHGVHEARGDEEEANDDEGLMKGPAANGRAMGVEQQRAAHRPQRVKQRHE